MDTLKFPIGRYQKAASVTLKELNEQIDIIGAFPDRLRREVQNLSTQQLETPYRNGGWTIRQVVHHCADSHLNSYIRLKLALTETNPTIKPYNQQSWSMLPDSLSLDTQASILLLDGLHQRWTYLLRSLDKEQLERTFIHPENNQAISVKDNVGLYAWHCNHHLAHIISLKRSRLW